MRNKYYVLMALLISLICLAYMVKEVNWDYLWELTRAVNPIYVVLVNLLFGVSLVLRSWRWQILLTPVKFCPFGKLFSAILIGFMANHVLPARLGEFVRVYAAKALARAPVASTLATIIIERVLDGLTICAAIPITLLFVDSSAQAGVFNHAFMHGATLMLLAGSLSVLTLLGALSRWPTQITGMIAGLLGRLSPRLAHRVSEFLITFSQGLTALKRHRALLRLVLLSFAIWTTFFFTCTSFLPAVGLPLEPRLGAMALLGAILACLVPAAPGSIGTFQLSVFWALMLVGTQPDRAMAYSILLWAALYFPITFIGLMEMYRHGISFVIFKDKTQGLLEG